MTIAENAKSQETSVLVGESVLQHLQSYLIKNNSRVFILMDENTFRFTYPILTSHVPFLQRAPYVIIAPGDHHKNLQSCEKVWKYLLNMQATRDDVLINCGGGVVCDLGGFAASVYKRGMSFINVPTTLLSMADASFGGKTSINFEQHKNLIGSFNEPLRVYIDPVFLKSLSTVHLQNGMAEIIKHGVIDGNELLSEIEQISSNGIPSISVIQKCVRLKLKITQKDLFDRGERKKLNYGHTIGHAIESACMNRESYVLHGEAIALGMLSENILSEKHLGFSESQRVFKILSQHCRLINISDLSFDSLIPYLLNDKKKENDKIQFSLPVSIGTIKTNVPIALNEIQMAFDHMKLMLTNIKKDENKI
ncbi:MAG TPA: 3-dehydroquinate synthase [Bacteroidia bacterium]|nr:3-dehydroquinate synthase [Bacteroidia bacterium]HNT79908.1 3-dehydroquinate synthase [Bacteroidia bacterium]